MHRVGLSVFRVGFLAAVTLVLAACTSVRPIETTPSKTFARTVPQKSALGASLAPGQQPRIVAVCYNGMVNSDADVRAEAALSCSDGKLTLREDDVLWTRCPLLQPQRANFICLPPQAQIQPQSLPQTQMPAQ